jgi:hypothetical protein
MKKARDKIVLLTQELIENACSIKYGNVSIDLHIHNGRISKITKNTTISVQEYLTKEVGLSSLENKD